MTRRTAYWTPRLMAGLCAVWALIGTRAAFMAWQDGAMWSSIGLAAASIAAVALGIWWAREFGTYRKPCYDEEADRSNDGAGK